MIYLVIVMRSAGVEATFADALAGKVKPRRVYVAGMTEEAALAAAFSDQQVVDMEEDEPDAATLLRFTYSEPIGSESDATPYENVLALAKQRAQQLTAYDAQKLARALGT